MNILYKEYVLYFLLEQQNPGEFIEGSVRKCATIVSEKIALTAGHCIPEGISNNYPIKLYDNSGKTYVVNALRVCKPGDQNDDYAILKIIEGNFAKIPNGLALPCDGERYFVLGYDAEYPHVSHLSCFSGRFRNTKIYANQSFVIGSPGTTDGCCGGGVFDQFGHLLGICVSGKLDWTNIRQPSYSHIVSAHYCMAIAKEILK
uniref:Uncharacterized protein n=1 Tax=Acrobeloides nanus TaxID=290746 RepID=A0A914CEM3_9BILA